MLSWFSIFLLLLLSLCCEISLMPPLLSFHHAPSPLLKTRRFAILEWHTSLLPVHTLRKNKQTLACRSVWSETLREWACFCFFTAICRQYVSHRQDEHRGSGGGGYHNRRGKTSFWSPEPYTFSVKALCYGSKMKYSFVIKISQSANDSGMIDCWTLTLYL